jgi:hypothetical protein
MQDVAYRKSSTFSEKRAETSRLEYSIFRAEFGKTFSAEPGKAGEQRM